MAAKVESEAPVRPGVDVASPNYRPVILEWVKRYKRNAPTSTHLEPARVADKISRFYEEAQHIPHLDRVVVGYDGAAPMIRLILVLAKDPPSPEEVIRGEDADDRRLFQLELQLWRSEGTPAYSRLASKAIADEVGDTELLRQTTPPGTRYLGVLTHQP